MTELTPEALASLRAINRTHGLHPDQIDALLDALAAERTAREEAEREREAAWEKGRHAPRHAIGRCWAADCPCRNPYRGGGK